VAYTRLNEVPIQENCNKRPININRPLFCESSNTYF